MKCKTSNSTPTYLKKLTILMAILIVCHINRDSAVQRLPGSKARIPEESTPTNAFHYAELMAHESQE